ncbi:TetR/AcrR family transcriptional regulator [Patulibacter minatonensis]|uniref:TetR/AcrR family transcriptional regulator n=1 Tax=Patulibacter minatonensis TaxID=298163 RepID=UPI000478BB73|nr:TetR/AcrR family transcriptional regulator [Patulibacter minatonensis]
MPLARTTSKAAEARRQGHAAFLDAAERAVAEGESYSDVSIAGLATSAGFSRASFYAYFTDKRALAVAVAERFEQDLGERVDDWLDGDDIATVRPTIDGVAAVFGRHRGAVLLLAEAATYDPEIRERWKALHARFEQRIAAWIERATPGTPKATAKARAFALAWSTQAVLVEHLADRERVAPAIVDALAAQWEAGLTV